MCIGLISVYLLGGQELCCYLKGLMEYLLRAIRCIELMFCIPAGRAGADCGECLGVDQAGGSQSIQVGGLNHRVAESSDLEQKISIAAPWYNFPASPAGKICRWGIKGSPLTDFIILKGVSHEISSVFSCISVPQASKYFIGPF
jgi:hypothetical protein